MLVYPRNVVRNVVRAVQPVYFIFGWSNAKQLPNFKILGI